MTSAIAKYLEAAERATAGPWSVMPDGFSRKNPRPTVYATDSDLRYIAFCDDAMTTGEPTSNLGNAAFIAAARNAADEVRELVELCRKMDVAGLTDREIDRIRELVR